MPRVPKKLTPEQMAKKEAALLKKSIAEGDKEYARNEIKRAKAAVKVAEKEVKKAEKEAAMAAKKAEKEAAKAAKKAEKEMAKLMKPAIKGSMTTEKVMTQRYMKEAHAERELMKAKREMAKEERAEAVAAKKAAKAAEIEAKKKEREAKAAEKAAKKPSEKAAKKPAEKPAEKKPRKRSDNKAKIAAMLAAFPSAPEIVPARMMPVIEVESVPLPPVMAVPADDPFGSSTNLPDVPISTDDPFAPRSAPSRPKISRMKFESLVKKKQIEIMKENPDFSNAIAHSFARLAVAEKFSVKN